MIVVVDGGGRDGGGARARVMRRENRADWAETTSTEGGLVEEKACELV